MKDSATNTPADVHRFYNELPNRFVAWAAVGSIGLFGLTLLVTGLSREVRNGLAGRQADDMFLIVIGAVMAGGAGLLARHLFIARVTLTPTQLVVSRWVGSRRFALNEITGLARYRKTIKTKSPTEPAQPAAGLSTYTVEVMILRLPNRCAAQFTLPQFYGNVELLELLQQRTGLQFNEFGDEEAKAQAWRKGVDG
ncbi:hypothetical protein [Stieleria sp.]|uniref:hypothetical protein n=1 Tax=Stieleria sp. TaxID=2795976 RepID=UPI00356AC0CD